MNSAVLKSHLRKAIGNFVKLSLSLILLSNSPGELRASSPEAWKEFREDVRKVMDEAVKGKLRNYVITVDPFGTQSYGVAVASGISRQDQKATTLIGVYNKKTKELEIVEFPSMKTDAQGGGEPKAEDAAPHPLPAPQLR